MIRLMSAFCLLAAGTASANAHAGHIGDLAGHSHWLGWAAVAGAGLIAAWLGVKARKEGGEENQAEVEDQAEPAGEKA